MWNLAPQLISSTIWALGPPLMTGVYKEEIPRNNISFPPGGASSGGASGKAAFNINSLSPTELKTFKAGFDQLDVAGTGFITFTQFKGYIAGDEALKTPAAQEAFIKKINKDGDDKISF